MKYNWDCNIHIDLQLSTVHWASDSFLQVDLHIHCNTNKNSSEFLRGDFYKINREE